MHHSQRKTLLHHTPMRYLQIILLLFFTMLLSGCLGESSTSELVPEVEERAFLRGKQFLRENKPDEALLSFEKVIDKRLREGKSAPESHLEVGKLYLEHIGDPYRAIYHYTRFLEMKPGTEKATLVTQQIESAKKEIIRSLPGPSVANGIDRLDMMELLKEVKKENQDLKRQLEQARQYIIRLRGNPDTVIIQNPVAETNPQNTSRQQPIQLSGQGSNNTQQSTSSRVIPTHYTVQSGDTLYGISIQIYGNSSRFMDIYEANRDVMRTPSSLKPGMELVIPK